MPAEEPKIIRVQIHHPVMGLHNFQLNSKENFSDLRLLLSENTTMTIFQNFRFEHNGQTLSQFQQIGTTVQNQSRINLILEPFDQKSSLYHFGRVKEILADPLEWLMLSNNNKQNLDEKQTSYEPIKPQNINVDNFLDHPLTSYLSADPFELLRAIPVHFYESLTFSYQSNPPPLYKKITGDFYYIQIRTIQGHDFQISAGPQGFTTSNGGSSNTFCFYNLLDAFKYLSPSFAQNFTNLKKTYYCPTQFEKSLYISHRDPPKKQWMRPSTSNFSRKKSHSQKNTSQTMPNQITIPQNSPITWSYEVITNPNFEHFARDSLFIKDWNEIIQIQSILPEDTPLDIANKQKNRYKIYQDYISLAKQAAIKVVEGQIPPSYQFEGGEGIQYGLFQYGSIVAWTVEDDPMSYSIENQDYGSISEEQEEYSPTDRNFRKKNKSRKKPRISRRTINTQIKNLEYLFKSRNLQLGYRHTVLVRYKGYSIVVQTIVPGLPIIDFFLKNSQNQPKNKKKTKNYHKNIESLNYLNFFKGDTEAHRQNYRQKWFQKNTKQSFCEKDKRKQIQKKQSSVKATDNKQYEDYAQIIEKVAKNLKLSYKNMYRNDNSQTCSAYIHPKLHALEGVDRRHYLINLYTLSPRDCNYSGIDNSGSVLRRELLLKYEYDENQIGGISNKNSKSSFSSNTSTLGTEFNTMIDAGYRMIFSEKLSQQFLKLQKIKQYVKDKPIAQCLLQFLTSQKRYLADSKSVIKIMHKNGLSSRYLGVLCSTNNILAEIRMQYPHVRMILKRVILVKTLKSIFHITMKEFQTNNGANGEIKMAIARLLNCLFCTDKKVLEEFDEQSRETREKDKQDENSSTTVSKKKKKKNQNLMQGATQRKNQQNLSWETNSHILKKKKGIEYKLWTSGVINPTDLTKCVIRIAEYRYGYRFSENFREDVFGGEQISKKTALLRDICISLGIVLEKNQYFEKDGGYLFKGDNILQIKPLVKHIKIYNQTLEEIVDKAENSIQNKKLEEGVEIYHSALNYTTTNFGLMNERLGFLNKRLGELYFKLGDIDTATMFISCAVKVFQKINGISDVETLDCYSLLSQFHFLRRSFELSEYYMLKMIKIATFSFGEEYPELLCGYLNLSSIYEGCYRFMDAIVSVTKALEIVLKIYGQIHINAVTCYSAMSAVYFQVPDISKAIFFQNKSIQIMRELGIKKQDPFMKEGLKVLEFYQSLQSSKKVRENHEKQKKKFMEHQLGIQLMRFPENSQGRRWGSSQYMMNTCNIGINSQYCGGLLPKRRI